MSKFSVFRKYNEDGAASTLYGVFDFGNSNLDADIIMQAIDDSFRGLSRFEIKEVDESNSVISGELSIGTHEEDVKVRYIASKVDCPLSELAKSCITRHRSLYPEISLEWFMDPFESSLAPINPIADRWWAYMHNQNNVRASVFCDKGEYRLSFSSESKLKTIEIRGNVVEPYELEF